MRFPILCDKITCTGCAACANICPVSCIEMKQDAEGFLFPNVDLERCTQCLLCEEHCPVLHPNPDTNYITPKVYAAWHKDLNIRLKSSSGGAFSALAEYVINSGGVVFGASYDEDLNVNHSYAESIDALDPLRSSKYSQSYIGQSYNEIRTFLKLGKLVLFVGTPCQVSGLISYLGKPHENLILCDLVCHGVPSGLLFHKYKIWLADKIGSFPTNFNFRDKTKGWMDSLRVGKFNGKTIQMNGAMDAYFLFYNLNLTLRESCYNCPSIGFPRKGDITIGDFWGIGKSPLNRGSNIHHGISLILANNAKGVKYLSLLDKNLIRMEKTVDDAIHHNKPLIIPPERPIGRNTFYRDLESVPFESLIVKYRNLSLKTKCISWIRENMPRNLLIFLRSIFNKFFL